MKNFISILIFLSLQSRKVKLLSVEEILENVNFYSKELCSNNGIPKYNKASNEVTCECGEKYANEPRKNKKKYINGHFVQCSYERKSRFYTIFLSVCFPFGFDFLYLERYIIFSIVFSISIFIVVLYIITFIANYNIGLKTKETKIQNKLNKMINNKKAPKNNEENKSNKRLNLACTILLINHFIYMSIDLSLHLAGIITDGNKVETENDFMYLFSLPD